MVSQAAYPSPRIPFLLLDCLGHECVASAPEVCNPHFFVPTQAVQISYAMGHDADKINGLYLTTATEDLHNGKPLFQGFEDHHRLLKFEHAKFDAPGVRADPEEGLDAIQSRSPAPGGLLSTPGETRHPSQTRRSSSLRTDNRMEQTAVRAPGCTCFHFAPCTITSLRPSPPCLEPCRATSFLADFPARCLPATTDALTAGFHYALQIVRPVSSYSADEGYWYVVGPRGRYLARARADPENPSDPSLCKFALETDAGSDGNVWEVKQENGTWKLPKKV